VPAGISSVASVSESGLSESSALDSSEPQAAYINTVDASAESSPSPSPQASVNVVGGADSTDNSTAPSTSPTGPGVRTRGLQVNAEVGPAADLLDCDCPPPTDTDFITAYNKGVAAAFADPTLNSCIITVPQSCPCGPDVFVPLYPSGLCISYLSKYS